jgi:hypothetical protein
MKYILEYHYMDEEGREKKILRFSSKGTLTGLSKGLGTKMTRSDALQLAAIFTTMEQRSGLSAEDQGTYVVVEVR